LHFRPQLSRIEILLLDDATPAPESGPLRSLTLAFGSELQLERERRDITLASIAEVTKVPHRHLLALETERFDILPGGIFNKGILRSYCRQIGLNEEEWLQKMPSALTNDPAQEWTQFAGNVSRSRVSSAPRMQWRWWGVLLMMIALSALSWAAWRYVVQPQLITGDTPINHSLAISIPRN